MANFWARKSTAALTQEAAEGGSDVHAPKRALSALNLVGLGIGGTIGAGIFVLTGTCGRGQCGTGGHLSFALGAVACAFAGLCYAELSSTIPISGSAYTYAYATMGELIAWIIGWDLILEYAVAAAAVAVGWSGYVVNVAQDLGIDHSRSKFASAPYPVRRRAAQLVVDRRDPEYSSGICRRGDHGLADGRHQGDRAIQRFHRRAEADRDLAVYHLRGRRPSALRTG